MESEAFRGSKMIKVDYFVGVVAKEQSYKLPSY